MSFAGIDIGSLTTKIVLIKENRIIHSKVALSGHNFAQSAKNLWENFLLENNLTLEQIGNIVMTGYGRHSIPEITDQVVTEITAHALGILYFYPDVQTIIDIGGQDSKVIKIDPKSHNVIDFQMNDKCAAGTGRFLEVMAKALEISVEEIGPLSLKSSNPAEITSMCTVFAESEVIGLFANGIKREDVAAGIHQSIARRVAAMVKRINFKEPVAFCGGVALNPAVGVALENELGVPLKTVSHPQITGALGAALIAAERFSQK